MFYPFENCRLLSRLTGSQFLRLVKYAESLKRGKKSGPVKNRNVSSVGTGFLLLLLIFNVL